MNRISLVVQSLASSATARRPRKTWVISSILVAAACGGGEGERKPTTITATANIAGADLVVEAKCDSSAKIIVAGTEGDCRASQPAVVRIPLRKLGAPGKKTLSVIGRGSGPEMIIEVAVDVPEIAYTPMFKVEKCAKGTGGEYIDLDAGGKTLDCSTIGGARAKLTLEATPMAKLTLGAKVHEVPASGELEVSVDLSEGILALSIDDLVERKLGSDAPKLTVPWKLETKGKQLDGKLVFTTKFGSHRQVVDRWLRDIVDGKIDRPAFAARASGRKTALRVPTDKYSELTVTDRRGTVREIELIVVERESGRTKAGVCEFDSKGKVVKATRYGVDVEVKVISSVDGSVIATKEFRAPKGCPSFAMLTPGKPEVAIKVNHADVMSWLDTLTTRDAKAKAAGPVKAASL